MEKLQEHMDSDSKDEAYEGTICSLLSVRVECKRYIHNYDNCYIILYSEPSLSFKLFHIHVDTQEFKIKSMILHALRIPLQSLW